MAVPGVDIIKKFAINQVVHNSVRTYFVGATLFGMNQWYARQTTFNLWFGKVEMDRRIDRGQL